MYINKLWCKMIKAIALILAIILVLIDTYMAIEIFNEDDEVY